MVFPDRTRRPARGSRPRRRRRRRPRRWRRWSGATRHRQPGPEAAGRRRLGGPVLRSPLDADTLDREAWPRRPGRRRARRADRVGEGVDADRQHRDQDHGRGTPQGLESQPRAVLVDHHAPVRVGRLHARSR